MTIWKAYHFPTCHEFFFTMRPLIKSLREELKKVGHDEDEWMMDEFEITKVVLVNNNRSI